MEAKPLSIGKILGERQRFVVPIYQRTYSWGRREIEPLIEQIESKALELLANGKVAFSHYMGALLLIPESDPIFGRIQAFNVVDGQQRLTTFHLCFAALRDVARHYGFNEVAQQLSDLIVHNEQTPMQDKANERYKLQPTTYDRTLFRDLIDLDLTGIQKKYPNAFYKKGTIRSDAPEALSAYWLFWNEAEGFITEDKKLNLTSEHDSSALKTRLVALSTVIYEHFRLIVITLSAADDAQVIFETLNSGGKPLAAMDLVRNDVFHRASRRGDDQEILLQKYWLEFEQNFWKQEQTQGRIKKPRIDFFLAHVMAAEQGAVVPLGELFAGYKSFVAKRSFLDISSELDTLTRHAPTYRALIEPQLTGDLAKLARRLNAFDVSTAYPLVLVVTASDADDEVKKRLYDLIASYVIRRALCYLTAKSYNNTFVEVAAYMKMKGISEDSFCKFFLDKSNNDTSRFPTDEDVREAILTRPQYGYIPQNRLKLLFEEIEFASRDKFNVYGTLQDGLSIEHIMPQNWAANWPLPDGVFAPTDSITGITDAMRLQISERNALIHTLGNLTLLTPSANSSASHASFEHKKNRLNDSLLKINIIAAAEVEWSHQAIRARAEKLFQTAAALWPSPKSS